ncbi:hypothetical protein IGJ12_000222 [Enterococcus sp. DIV0802b]
MTGLHLCAVVMLFFRNQGRKVAFFVRLRYNDFS